MFILDATIGGQPPKVVKPAAEVKPESGSASNATNPEGTFFAMLNGMGNIRNPISNDETGGIGGVSGNSAV